MKNFYIPKPCFEDWESMSPEEKGRFCSVCSKTVIDFTQKQPHEIQQIMEEKKGERVCGKFYDHQLKAPKSEMNGKYYLSNFQNNELTLSLFSFLLLLTGCSKPKEEVCSTTGIAVMLEEDSTLVNNNYVIGEALIENDTIAKIPPKDSAMVSQKPGKK